MAELERLSLEPPESAELDRARNYAAGIVQIRRQSTAAVAGDVLEGWVNGKLADVDRASEQILNVTRDDVVEVASRIFKRENGAEFLLAGRRNNTKT